MLGSRPMRRVQRRYRDAVRRAAIFIAPQRPFVTFEPDAYLHKVGIRPNDRGVMRFLLARPSILEGVRAYGIGVRLIEPGGICQKNRLDAWGHEHTDPMLILDPPPDTTVSNMHIRMDGEGTGVRFDVRREV